MHPYKDDLELIQSAVSGNHQAFRQIVLKYEDDVARTVIGMLGKTEDAEDIGQEVFIRFYKSLKQFKGESSLKTYLTRIAINLSLNRLKQISKRRIIPIEEQGNKIVEEKKHDDEMELKEIVNLALGKLDPEFRSVIVLRLIQGFSTRETANMLDIPLGTVLSRLSRAQEKLKIELQNLGWEN